MASFILSGKGNKKGTMAQRHKGTKADQRLSPTPPPGERGYVNNKQHVTPFSPGRRGQGD
jgi:hypothetical protein